MKKLTIILALVASGYCTINAQFSKVGIISGENSVSSATVNSASQPLLHADIDSPIVPIYELVGSTAPVSFYVDFNRDGAFTDEIIAQSGADGFFAQMRLPQTVSPGKYLARFEDAAGNVQDVMLNLHHSKCRIILDVANGYVLGAEGHGLPGDVDFSTDNIAVSPRPTLPGFRADKLTVRHGHNLGGSQDIGGIRQWEEFDIPVGETTMIAPESIDGDILIYGVFAGDEAAEWTQIWGDEFNGTELDMDKWSYHPRGGAAWSRFIAKGDECEVVNKIGDGVYTAYCMATPDEFKPAETAEMISGAIYTSGKFSCLNGYIEARIKTTPHIGNFPAFWMMPTTKIGWPKGGEMDIWETIDTENRAYQTIHSGWANPGESDLPPAQQPSPAKGCFCEVDPAEYHIYSLEWDQESLKFYVDGKLNFTYKNTHYSDPVYTEYLAWPFSKPFYIICNQSVGKGTWAAEPDPSFVYHTEFDYVRVYEKMKIEN